MAGDAGSFANYVAARERALQRSAWLLTGDWALAEDLVQTALAKTWPRWEGLVRRDDPDLYVRRVLVNTYRSWWRRRWRGEAPTEQLPDTATDADLAERAAVRLAVAQALDKLTRRQRAVVVLRVFDDLTEAQTARVLGCAVGTVKSTTAQALAKLRADPAMRALLKEESR